MSGEIEMLKSAIRQSKNICVFTGAGISCPSGIPDFRSADGIYSERFKRKYSPEQIVSHTFFVRYPEVFFDFYKQRMVYAEAKPNAAHLYFAELERRGKCVSVVTQNIDGLHSAAGSGNVIELHGSIHRNRCTKCGRFYPLDYIVGADGVPYCEDDGGIIKPEVVLYEEPLDDETVRMAINAVESADLLIIIGTSLRVYPAASFVRYFHGQTLAVINKSEIDADLGADIVINDDIVNVIEKLKI